ncbi:hypothetical protein HaLaN_07841 [Haematococcus lacustris]|uniref:Uncharacterized protein n=1 Tax=Haematococcus lacustris TaxID=44745 RepID=A0A699Z9K2_HAELA|nr:hypothetical protein HaLaN_07841 [Haematococcus lacustris]
MEYTLAIAVGVDARDEMVRILAVDHVAAHVSMSFFRTCGGAHRPDNDASTRLLRGYCQAET